MLTLLNCNKQSLSRILLRHLLLSMLSRLDNVLAIVESARVSECLMRTDCDKLLTHGIEVETMAVKCLLERPDVVDLHKGAKDLRFVVLMTEALGPLRWMEPRS